MSLIDIAAIVGALAWAPPIIGVIKNWLTRPKVRVMTQPQPEIGYTNFGAILNLRLALTVTHRDIVITSMRLVVTHESNETKTLVWRGITQRMGTLGNQQMGAVQFEKEVGVLAMKVSPKDIEERFIRFQELDYIERKEELEAAASKKLAHCKQAGVPIDAGFLKSPETHELLSFMRQSFGWKPGRYTVRVELQSPEAFDIVDDHYAFSLSPLHVQQLSENVQFLARPYLGEALPATEGAQLPPVQWNWVYPEMRSTGD